jgi:isoprenylcysteine carboxyl methyltransferase (ICMT) family protein YpbQ
MKSREEKIRRRDERFLRRERSWQRARAGAICFSIMHVLILLAVKYDEFSSAEEKKECFLVFGIWLLFWLLIVSWLNSRLGHIDSIKLYRKANSADEQKQ